MKTLKKSHLIALTFLAALWVGTYVVSDPAAEAPVFTLKSLSTTKMDSKGGRFTARYRTARAAL